MNTTILCICCDPERFVNWKNELEEDGYVVVHANDEREALLLLKACSVDVICIDSAKMTELGSKEVVAGLNAAPRHVPVVLIQSGAEFSERFEEHVDVVIDEPTFSMVGSWLVEELREIRFPVFTEWFETWRDRRAVSGQIQRPFTDSAGVELSS